MGVEDELADVRRLLKETTDKAQRLEMELELARRTAKDLMDGFAEKERLLRQFAETAAGIIALVMVETSLAGTRRLQDFITLAGRAKDLTDA